VTRSKSTSPAPPSAAPPLTPTLAAVPDAATTGGTYKYPLRALTEVCGGDDFRLIETDGATGRSIDVSAIEIETEGAIVAGRGAGMWIT
jgi:hypothetical protein